MSGETNRAARSRAECLFYRIEVGLAAGHSIEIDGMSRDNGTAGAYRYASDQRRELSQQHRLVALRIPVIEPRMEAQGRGKLDSYSPSP